MRFPIRLVLIGRGGCWVLPASRAGALVLMIACFPPGYSCPRWPLFPLPLAVGTSAGPWAAFPMPSSCPRRPCSAADLRRSWFTFHAEPTLSCGQRDTSGCRTAGFRLPCCFTVAMVVSRVAVVIVCFAAYVFFFLSFTRSTFPFALLPLKTGKTHPHKGTNIGSQAPPPTCCASHPLRRGGTAATGPPPWTTPLKAPRPPTAPPVGCTRWGAASACVP